MYSVNLEHIGDPVTDPAAQLEVWICDEKGAQWFNIFGGILNPLDTYSFTDRAATATMVSSSYGGYTFQIANISVVGAGALNCYVSAFDSDGLGTGQNRDTYNLTPFFSSPITFTCCDDTASSGNLIRINKRTTLNITISP